jgi:hypothetical protein
LIWAGTLAACGSSSGGTPTIEGDVGDDTYRFVQPPPLDTVPGPFPRRRSPLHNHGLEKPSCRLGRRHCPQAGEPEPVPGPWQGARSRQWVRFPVPEQGPAAWKASWLGSAVREWRENNVPVVGCRWVDG